MKMKVAPMLPRPLQDAVECFAAVCAINRSAEARCNVYKFLVLL